MLKLNFVLNVIQRVEYVSKHTKFHAGAMARMAGMLIPTGAPITYLPKRNGFGRLQSSKRECVKQVRVIEHLPQDLELAPADFFLFRMTKEILGEGKIEKETVEKEWE